MEVQTWTDRPEDAAVSTGGSPAPWSGRARVQLQTDQQLGPAGPARLPSIPPCTGPPPPPGTCSPRLLHVLTLQKTLIFAGRPGDQERLATCVTCLARGQVPSMSSFTCNSFGLKEPGVLVWAVCPGFGHLGRDAAAFALLPSPPPPHACSPVPTGRCSLPAPPTRRVDRPPSWAHVPGREDPALAVGSPSCTRSLHGRPLAEAVLPVGVQAGLPRPRGCDRVLATHRGGQKGDCRAAHPRCGGSCGRCDKRPQTQWPCAQTCGARAQRPHPASPGRSQGVGRLLPLAAPGRGALPASCGSWRHAPPMARTPPRRGAAKAVGLSSLTSAFPR